MSVKQSWMFFDDSQRDPGYSLVHLNWVGFTLGSETKKTLKSSNRIGQELKSNNTTGQELKSSNSSGPELKWSNFID